MRQQLYDFLRKENFHYSTQNARQIRNFDNKNGNLACVLVKYEINVLKTYESKETKTKILSSTIF